MIVDTHLHIIDKKALDYPWLANVPALDSTHSYETYAAEAQRCGIAKTLHMEVDVAEPQIEDETRYVKELAAKPGSLLTGAIASCRPESRDFPAYLERCQNNPFVKGLRRVLHVMPDDLSETDTFRANIARIGETSLTFDLCVFPRQMDAALAVVNNAPRTTFILDHCGVPDIAGGAMDGWKAGISSIARRPNVVVKLSGIIAYADPNSWTVAELRPWVHHVIEAFGFERMVWGSDWPVCKLGGSLSSWVAATHALLEGVTLEEKRLVLSGNAERIWSL